MVAVVNVKLIFCILITKQQNSDIVKKWILSLMMMCLCALMYAQDAQGLLPSLDTNATMYLNFTVHQKGAENIAQGKAYLNLHAYRIDINDMLIVNDGKTLYNYNKDINELTIFNAEDDQINYPALVDAYFNSVIDALLAQHKDSVSQIPIESDIIDHADLKYGDDSGYPTEIKLVGSGVEYIIEVVDSNITHEHPKNLYVFDKSKYPGLVITDMR